MTLSITLLAYGLEYFIPYHYRFLFSALSIFTRFLEGVGAAVAMASFLSLAFVLYPT